MGQEEGGEGRRRRKQQGGSDDGILFELNCGVKGRDGSVNSNKSHILCLHLRLVRSYGRRSRLEQLLRDPTCFWRGVSIYVHLSISYCC